jgi:hypothetical protein
MPTAVEQRTCGTRRLRSVSVASCTSEDSVLMRDSLLISQVAMRWELYSLRARCR